MFHANMEPLPDLIILDAETAAATPYTPPVYNSAKREAVRGSSVSVSASSAPVSAANASVESPNATFVLRRHLL